MARKLTDSDVADLRSRWEDGWNAIDLAAAFGISRQHVGRIVKQQQRATIAGLDAERVHASVEGAVEEFLGGLELRDGDEVLAATARMLARKLDACSASDAIAAAHAAPRLAAELAATLERIRTPVDYVPDALDELIARRDARRLADAAEYNRRRAPLN
jgi:ABC-type nitrate/sulfonate/bicarbonate transport system substrate-binding protein